MNCRSCPMAAPVRLQLNNRRSNRSRNPAQRLRRTTATTITTTVRHKRHRRTIVRQRFLCTIASIQPLAVHPPPASKVHCCRPAGVAEVALPVEEPIRMTRGCANVMRTKAIAFGMNTAVSSAADYSIRIYIYSIIQYYI